jgi:hypothetical protein
LLEEIIGRDVSDAEIVEENVTAHVEMVKTMGMLSSKEETYCQDCEPLFIETPMSKGWCKCTIYSHFSKSWRCIPCVLAEETKQISSKQSFKVIYDPRLPRDRMYQRVRIIPSHSLQRSLQITCDPRRFYADAGNSQMTSPLRRADGVEG